MGRYLGDATLTAAILDRLAMQAIRIDVDGPSYRQHVAKKRADRGATETARDVLSAWGEPKWPEPPCAATSTLRTCNARERHRADRGETFFYNGRKSQQEIGRYQRLQLLVPQSEARIQEMIAPEKQRSALAAINAVLVIARAMAYEGKSSEVAEVLDVAEYLPMLMLEPTDRTEEFREQLVGLVSQRPNFYLAVERFDSTT